jgi:hypothetical protein
MMNDKKIAELKKHTTLEFYNWALLERSVIAESIIDRFITDMLFTMGKDPDAKPKRKKKK